MAGPFSDDGLEIIAHRGYSARAPENTLAALEAALDAGAVAVEWDVHTAACGTPVLFHDQMLSRTTNGVGPLRRRTIGQLRSLDAGKWFGPEFAGERIPSLHEALNQVRDRVTRVYSEIKGFRELEDVDRIVRITREAGMLDRTVFISLNWIVLDRVRGQNPDTYVGYIVDDAEDIDEALDRSRGDAAALVDYRADLLTEDPGRVERTRRQGTPLAVWTVDDVNKAAHLHSLGVRRLTTNQVDTLLEWARSV